MLGVSVSLLTLCEDFSFGWKEPYRMRLRKEEGEKKNKKLWAFVCLNTCTRITKRFRCRWIDEAKTKKPNDTSHVIRFTCACVMHLSVNSGISIEIHRAEIQTQSQSVSIELVANRTVEINLIELQFIRESFSISWMLTHVRFSVIWFVGSNLCALYKANSDEFQRILLFISLITLIGFDPFSIWLRAIIIVATIFRRIWQANVTRHFGCEVVDSVFDKNSSHSVFNKNNSQFMYCHNWKHGQKN